MIINILLSLFIQITLFQICAYATNYEEKIFLIVEVVTPSKQVYDDGINRSLFSSFFILDSQGNKIVSSGEVFDYAAKIKLKEGSYTIFNYNLAGELVHQELNIKLRKGNMLQIKLE
jgi:cell division protein YceG involved in septum cleavage